MREAIGGISIFQIVVIFILIFAAIMSLTINHSKSFSIKDEVITIIESNAGLSKGSARGNTLSSTAVDAVKTRLQEIGYRTRHKCSSGFTGYTYDGAQDNNNATYCVRYVSVDGGIDKNLQSLCNNGTNCKYGTGDFPHMGYYEVEVFYSLDVPFLGDFTNFKMTGSTKVLFD